MSNIIPHSPKLADLTLLEVQDAWIVDANEDYSAIIEAQCREMCRPLYTSSTPSPQPKSDRLALSLAIGSFVIAGLGVAFIAGSFSKAVPPPTPSPAPTPQIIVIPPQKPADRCLAFCSGD
jgi:hypothetical protein